MRVTHANHHAASVGRANAPPLGGGGAAVGLSVAIDIGHCLLHQSHVPVRVHGAREREWRSFTGTRPFTG